MVFVLPVLLSKKPFDPLAISIGALVYATSAGVMWLWRNTPPGRKAAQYIELRSCNVGNAKRKSVTRFTCENMSDWQQCHSKR